MTEITETEFTKQADAIIAENAGLHQTIDIQRIIQAGVNTELMEQRRINHNLRVIIAYIVAKEGGTYRLPHKVLVAHDQTVAEIDISIEPQTNDWVLKLKEA